MIQFINLNGIIKTYTTSVGSPVGSYVGLSVGAFVGSWVVVLADGGYGVGHLALVGE